MLRHTLMQILTLPFSLKKNGFDSGEGLKLPSVDDIGKVDISPSQHVNFAFTLHILFTSIMKIKVWILCENMIGHLFYLDCSLLNIGANTKMPNLYGSSTAVD